MHGPIEKARIAQLRTFLDDALRQIPPLWPLDSSVAVNPFLGQSRERLAEAATRLGRLADAPVTMPRRWFKARIDGGEITDADLAGALAASPYAGKPSDPAELKHAAARSRPAPQPLPTIADLAANATGTDWPGIIADRIGAWAGTYFDAGQALWVAPSEIRAWRAYRIYATHDVTPEILGLSGFAAFVAAAPEDPEHFIARAADTLGLSEEALGEYFHQLLLTLGGWAQYGRYRQWCAEQAQQEDDTLIDLLAIRLLWEEALFLQHAAAVDQAWTETRAKHAEPLKPGKDDIIDELLQEAAERARQRRLADTLAEPAAPAVKERPQLQAAFCIDVRSEVFRRALESVDPGIRTLGFAGFFGVFVKHRRFASDVEEPRLPVLFRPTVSSCATGDDNREADGTTRYRARARRAWGRFKLAAVSCFAFVEAMGPIYIPKLLRDALGRLGRPPADTQMPRFSPPLDRQARIDCAETVLRAMSLTDRFARLVLLAGHGANVVNDPQASALHCGACGGYPGEVNARLLAGLLNDPEVRDGLAERGIAIPDDTLFVAGLHDTTTDRVDLYETDTPAAAHAADLAQLREWLAEAGRRARGERALRLPRARRGRDIRRRARDWSETRPEWGLAGCSAFIAAPRARTRGRNLDGRAFLHEYDWKPDSANGFSVLELILTAPVVVASWISLQYYGSTVAPTLFGAGNKLLHNVVGGIGVFEGNGGLLRAGLARQSVHDGERTVHEPLRLTVFVEAPREAVTDILKRHEEVRAVFDKGWLHLFALDENGRPAWRYAGDLDWTAEPPQRQADHGLRAVS